MIFSTFGQLKALYMTLLLSIISVLVVSILKIVLVYGKSKMIVKNIQLFFYTTILGFAFVVVSNLYNFGEFNMGLLACFLIGAYLFNKTIKKTVDFFSLKVYDIYISIIKWEKYCLAKKFGSIQD